MAVTLNQIAEMAKVSRGTVDRALHGRGRVNPELADKIVKIAEEMGYRPNKMGRALALSHKTITLGVIVQSAETPFMQMVLEGVEMACEELRALAVEVVVAPLSALGLDQELACIDRLVAQGVQGLAIFPTDDATVRERINYIIDALGIPVITFNSDIEGTRRMCFVGLDNVRSGQTAADLMGLALRGGGKVLPLTGHLTNRAHGDRMSGFLSECAKNQPQIELLPLQPCFDKDDYAYELTLHALQQHSDLSGVFVAANGQTGVCRALSEMKCYDRICHITYDLTPQNRKHLLDGHINIVIGQGALQQGYRPLILLYEFLSDGKRPAQEFLYTDILIKTRHNL